jgi:hypothetical protein
MCRQDDYPPHDLPATCQAPGVGCNRPITCTDPIRFANGHATIGVCDQHINPKPPLVLTGVDGNALAILGAAQKALKKAGYTKADIVAFNTEAMSGDYDRLLAACFGWFEVS